MPTVLLYIPIAIAREVSISVCPDWQQSDHIVLALVHICKIETNSDISENSLFDLQRNAVTPKILQNEIIIVVFLVTEEFGEFDAWN